MLVNLRRARRTEAVIKGQLDSNRILKDSSTDQTKLKLKQFKLATKMSKEMNVSNHILIKLMNTLNKTKKFGMQDDNEFEMDSDGEAVNIDTVDTATMLNTTNISIKNLNHTLMKLVAVQQESIMISKGSMQSF